MVQSQNDQNTIPLALVKPQDEAEDDIDFREYAGVIIDAKEMIAGITLVGLIFAVFYCFLATPEYSADALVQVEPEQTGGLPALEDVAGLFEGESSIDTEIELIKSRMVLGTAADKLSLQLQISPNYFPLIGKTLARRFESSSSGVADAFLGMSSYAWGGERLSIDVFEIPAALEDMPLLFRVEEAGAFSIWLEGQKLIEGRAGKLVQYKLKKSQSDSKADIATQAIDRLLQLHVSELVARPGTEFTIVKKPLQQITAYLNANLNVAEKGKKSGILAMTMVSSQREQVAELLNTIADVYVQQNVNRSSAEAELSLDFLEKQLPPLKEQLDAAENAYNQFRVQHGSIDLAAETEVVLTNISTIGAAILELEQQRNEIRKRFKPAHPSVRALDGKIAILRAEEERLDQSSDSLPEVQKDILRLAREVEMNTILYSKLLNTSQELKVAKAGTVGNVRVIDYAYEPKLPVKPNKQVVILLSTIVSLIFGIMLAFLFRAVRGGVDDPDEIERKLGVPIYGSVTHSKEQEAANKAAGKDENANLGILTAQVPDSLTVECLRSLRTSLHFSLQNARNNIILVAGSSSGIGKSFTSINLGAVLAEAGKTVLVIDADMRRGTIHTYIGQGRQNGLADLMTNPSANPMKFLKNTTIASMKVLTTGTLPASPAELLLHKDFEGKLQLLGESFDYVIIDGPPILAVTDSAIIGRHAGTTLLVVKSNHHQMRELEQAHKQFSQAGIEVKGIIFNDVRQSASSRGYGKYVYKYEYKAH